MPRNHNIRLSEEERNLLGKSATNSGQYSLTSEEHQTIREYRIWNGKIVSAAEYIEIFVPEIGIKKYRAL